MEVNGMGIFDGLNQLRKVNNGMSENSQKKTRYYDILNIYNKTITHIDKDTGEKQILDKVTVIIFDVDKPLYVTKIANVYPRITNHEIIVDELTNGGGVDSLMTRDVFKRHYSIKRKYFNTITRENRKMFNKSVKFEWYMVLPVIIVKRGVNRPALMIVRNQNVIKGFTSLDLDETKYNLTVGQNFDTTKPTLLITIDVNDPRNFQYTYTQKYNDFILNTYNTITTSYPIEIYQQSFDDFINYAKNKTRENKDEILVQVEYYLNELTNMMEYEIKKFEEQSSKSELEDTDDVLQTVTTTNSKRKQTQSMKIGNGISEERTPSDDEFDKLLESLSIDGSDDEDDEIPF
jgi:hypothetical protein